MANITIRNLDDAVKHGLRIRAARHGRSMEDEVRHILRDAVDSPAKPLDLSARIRARVAEFGGVELDLPPRDAMREPPAFDRA
ncbi:FitA-like ribbon-helix-helix domain-containing protein [Pseudogemmobacter sonorensis]|uniref:FitA-like ribbon-helix-helix domain-containing protein n=1 Tax=Pseudogemmobacter sonorensis TaxID=2989681 RepID=UPI0036777E72